MFPEICYPSYSTIQEIYPDAYLSRVSTTAELLHFPLSALLIAKVQSCLSPVLSKSEVNQYSR